MLRLLHSHLPDPRRNEQYGTVNESSSIQFYGLQVMVYGPYDGPDCPGINISVVMSDAVICTQDVGINER